MANLVFIINEESLGSVKQIVAQLLSKEGYGQTKISQILNITQPMVSNYLSSRISVPHELKSCAEKTYKKIIAGDSVSFNAAVAFTDKTEKNNISDSNYCEYYLAKKEELISDDKQYVVNNILKAISILEDHRFNKIVPKVKVNIAMARNKPQTKEDIASVAGGLIIVNDTISYYGDVGFGKSNHLSSILLYLDKINFSNAKAIMNIKYNEKLKQCRHLFFTDDYKLDEKMLEKNLSKNKQVDILLHKGAFGIEPCAYIIGRDAVDVANKVLKLL